MGKIEDKIAGYMGDSKFKVADISCEYIDHTGLMDPFDVTAFVRDRDRAEESYIEFKYDDVYYNDQDGFVDAIDECEVKILNVFSDETNQDYNDKLPEYYQNSSLVIVCSNKKIEDFTGDVEMAEHFTDEGLYYYFFVGARNSNTTVLAFVVDGIGRGLFDIEKSISSIQNSQASNYEIYLFASEDIKGYEGAKIFRIANETTRTVRNQEMWSKVTTPWALFIEAGDEISAETDLFKKESLDCFAKYMILVGAFLYKNTGEKSFSEQSHFGKVYNVGLIKKNNIEVSNRNFYYDYEMNMTIIKEFPDSMKMIKDVIYTRNNTDNIIEYNPKASYSYREAGLIDYIDISLVSIENRLKKNPETKMKLLEELMNNFFECYFLYIIYIARHPNDSVDILYPAVYCWKDLVELFNVDEESIVGIINNCAPLYWFKRNACRQYEKVAFIENMTIYGFVKIVSNLYKNSKGENENG